MSYEPKIHPFEFLFDFTSEINRVYIAGKYNECPYCGSELLTYSGFDPFICEEHGTITRSDYLEETRKWNYKANNAIEMIIKNFGRDTKKVSVKSILRMFEDYEESLKGV